MQQIDPMRGVASWWWQRARVVLDDAARAVNEGDSEYVVGAINDGPMYVECERQRYNSASPDHRTAEARSNTNCWPRNACYPQR